MQSISAVYLTWSVKKVNSRRRILNYTSVMQYLKRIVLPIWQRSSTWFQVTIKIMISYSTWYYCLFVSGQRGIQPDLGELWDGIFYPHERKQPLLQESSIRRPHHAVSRLVGLFRHSPISLRTQYAQAQRRVVQDAEGNEGQLAQHWPRDCCGQISGKVAIFSHTLSRSYSHVVLSYLVFHKYCYHNT